MEKFKVLLIVLALLMMVGWAINEMAEWNRLEEECLAQGNDEWFCSGYTRMDY